MRALFFLVFLFFLPLTAEALFTGNDQFDRTQLNNEALLDREYFTNLLAYAPFWEPPPAAPEPRAFVRNTEGSLTGERLLVRREVRVQGRISEKSFLGYRLRQDEDLEEAFFYQVLEAQMPVAGPLSFRIFGQPTSKKQDSDIGAGLVWDHPAAVMTVEGTWVDFNFNTRNLSDERDRTDLYSIRIKIQTPAGSAWQGEILGEWDSPLEREFPDENNLFGHRYAAAHASVQAGAWRLSTSWKREHRRLTALSSGVLQQDFRRQAWMGDIGWSLKEGPEPVRFGARVHRRTADFVDGQVPNASDIRSRWDVIPYALVDWRFGQKFTLATGVYAAAGKADSHAPGSASDVQNYAEVKLKTGLRWDFTPDVSLMLNPTWDLDRFFTHRSFDGGNIQFQARI